MRRLFVGPQRIPHIHIKGELSKMRFLDSWWERAPWLLRLSLVVVCLLAVALGGAADHYWE